MTASDFTPTPSRTQKQIDVPREVTFAGHHFLLVLDDAELSTVALPSEGSLVVGRISECGLKLERATVSRRHAEFIMREGQVRVRDLGSQNGTYVRGVRIEGEALVSTGDLISLGNVSLILQHGSNLMRGETAS